MPQALSTPHCGQGVLSLQPNCSPLSPGHTQMLQISQLPCSLVWLGSSHCSWADKLWPVWCLAHKTPLNTPPCLSPFSGSTSEAPCKRGQRPVVWVPKWLSEPGPHCQPEPSQTSQKSHYLVSLLYYTWPSHQINTLPVFLHHLDFDASVWTLFQYHLPIRASCLEFWASYISLITPTWGHMNLLKLLSPDPTKPLPIIYIYTS